MITTPRSLLERLRSRGDEQAWRRFVELYTPFILHCVRRAGVPEADSADLVQEVFTLLMTRLPGFHHDRSRSFGAWLRVITRNKCRDYFRGRRPKGVLAREPAAPDDAELFTEDEYRRFIAQRALKLMQTEFQDTTWRACWENVVEGRPAAEVADRLGISVNAVYVAKSRVLGRLREELDDLLE
jgi:RNA polymerase sigma-70 factor (ECF subfamily)